MLLIFVAVYGENHEDSSAGKPMDGIDTTLVTDTLADTQMEDKFTPCVLVINPENCRKGFELDKKGRCRRILK